MGSNKQICGKYELFVQDKCVCKLRIPRTFYKKHIQVKNAAEVFGGDYLVAERNSFIEQAYFHLPCRFLLPRSALQTMHMGIWRYLFEKLSLLAPAARFVHKNLLDTLSTVLWNLP